MSKLAYEDGHFVLYTRNSKFCCPTVPQVESRGLTRLFGLDYYRQPLHADLHCCAMIDTSTVHS
jgi:hypothetical protein